MHVNPANGKLVYSEFTKDLNMDGKADESDIRSSEIGVMDANGMNRTLLTNNESIDAAPVWSPDGGRILFVSDRDSPDVLDMYTMDESGGNLVNLTNTPFYSEADVHWVGDKIVFTRSSGPDFNPGVWIMDSDGANQRQLTDTSSMGISSTGYAFGDYDPKMAPNGNRIAFARHQNDTGNFGTGDFDIYVMNIDGTNLTDISKNTVADLMPTWSPDGNNLAFWVISDNLTDLGDIYVISPDGTERTKVTQEPDTLIERQPDWLSNTKIILSGETY
ncbi:MAG: hypothetical protein A2X58_04370 [Nitrospirae bacterium GWC2_56_14]|nr:MAG: hypothetical protein A2X58_04370 [Nitrospirae bacterium GWC2_56_14]